jgi:hypothetical protein
MFLQINADKENCLMFEWVKNVLHLNENSLIAVPSDPEKFRIFIDSYYDDKKDNIKSRLIL